MKKSLKQLIVLSLAVCCLAAIAACGSPGGEFAGEYEISSYEPYNIAAVDSNNAAVVKPYADANLNQAINDSIAMVGTKVKLTVKEILFRDSGTKFNVAEYQLSIPEEPELQIPENRHGYYEISTNDEKLIIIVCADKVNGNNVIQVCIYNYAIGVDGEEYRYAIYINFKTTMEK